MLACCRLPVRAPMTGLRSIRGLVTAQPLAREAPHCGADRLRLAATQRPISTLFASTCRRRAVHGSSNPNRPTVPLHSTLEAAGAPSKPKAVPRLLSCGYRAWYKHHHSRLKQLFKVICPPTLGWFARVFRGLSFNARAVQVCRACVH